MKYYHFDALGSTRRLSGASGAFTDSYSCTTWGHSIHYSGSTQQPYQYVGQLGYYTHYQDPWLPLLQLGVRFYDPGLGRFSQKDEVRDSYKMTYLYADDCPLFLTDPEGKKPSYKPDSSCIKLLGRPQAESCIRQTEDFLSIVQAKFPEANIRECGYDQSNPIKVKCKKSLGKTADGHAVCGGTSTSDGSITISVSPDCPFCYCAMLHETIHACSNRPDVKCWPKIDIPGCGDISAQNSTGD